MLCIENNRRPRSGGLDFRHVLLQMEGPFQEERATSPRVCNSGNKVEYGVVV